MSGLATAGVTLASLLAIVPRTADAQDSGSVSLTLPARVFTIVAVPDQFPYKGADAIIKRRANLLPHDVIILRNGTVTPQLLTEAALTLKSVWARHGHVPAADQIIRVRAPRAPQQMGARAGRLQAKAVPWAQHLTAKPKKNVPGIGSASYIGLLLRTGDVRVRRQSE